MILTERPSVYKENFFPTTDFQFPTTDFQPNSDLVTDVKTPLAATASAEYVPPTVAAPTEPIVVPGQHGERLEFGVDSAGVEPLHSLEQLTTCIWALQRTLEQSNHLKSLSQHKQGQIDDILGFLNRSLFSVEYGSSDPIFPPFADKEREATLTALADIYTNEALDLADQKRAADTASRILSDNVAKR